ncbi:MAG: CPBP family intramembrane glutamic endopeptidase [Armatimonadota bacterium]|nr:CPBP family intramembrane glutamic endopeptidase [Armatimonadota bacterium]MDR5697391.1 CPBP family intramembrane glutamic endopeptidase [Armatimonadota bacterium]
MSPSGLIYVAAAAYGGLWVYRDRMARGLGSAALWGLATALVFPAVFPIYVLTVRPRDPEASEWDVPEVVGLGVVIVLTLPLAVAVARVSGMDVASVGVLVVAQSAVLLAGCLYVARRYELPVTALGYRMDRWPVLVGRAVLLSVPVVAGAHYVVQPAAVRLLGLFIGQDQARLLAEHEERMNPIVQALPPLDDPVGVAWFAFLVCVLVPVAEETFFRGLAYPPLRRRYGAPLAMVVTAVVFGAAHFQIVNFLPITLLGCILAVLYERTGSLLPAIVLHGLNNLAALIASYVAR